jgi:uncharacterized protein (TIGR02444 family)
LHPSPRSPDPAAGVPPGQDFWDFAAAAWDRPEARQILLQWQDQREVDALLVLFACWAPRRLPPGRWASITRDARRWNHGVTRRIRVLRRRLQSWQQPEAYRACVALELTAEHIEANWLVSAWPAREADAAPAPDPARRLRRLFPAIPEAEIRALLDAIRAV